VPDRFDVGTQVQVKFNLSDSFLKQFIFPVERAAASETQENVFHPFPASDIEVFTVKYNLLDCP